MVNKGFPKFGMSQAGAYVTALMLNVKKTKKENMLSIDFLHMYQACIINVKF